MNTRITTPEQSIVYPYLPEGRSILQVSSEHPFMKLAREVALEHKGSLTHTSGAVLVKDNTVIGTGSIGSGFHRTNGCARQDKHVPTGMAYELCLGCHPSNHSEQVALANAVINGHDPFQAEVYLWGHWWCCVACWSALEIADVRQVYTLENAHVFFEKSHPNNFLGRQEEVRN